MVRHALALILFTMAGATAWTLAPRLAALAETRYAAQVDAALHAGGFRWATGKVDGLTVALSGSAPSDAAAEEALKIVSAISPVLTIANEISEATKTPRTIIPPQLEILKGENSLLLTGVIADEAMVQALVQSGVQLGDADSTMLTYGAAPFPTDWAATAPILKGIAESLAHARISLDDTAITITGLAATLKTRSALQPRLAALTALGWRVEAAIDAPPPVLPNFELTASRTIDAGATLSCAAATREDAEAIQTAAQTYLSVKATCEIGAGAPDAAWATASTAIIAALAGMPAARVQMAGKVANLVAFPPTTRDEATATKQSLTANLPPGYRLIVDQHALAKVGGPPVAPFHLIIDWPGGDAPLTIAGTQAKTGFDAAAPSLSAYARAQFPGIEAAISRTNGAAPPAGWRSAARIALEALSRLDRGSVTIGEGKLTLTLTGAASSHDALRAAHDDLMQVGEPWRATTRIAYDPARIAAAQPVPPTRCAADVAGVIAQAPLTFQPASTTLTTAAKTTVDRIAAILARCEGARFKIGGHTDAQGSEAGNLALSRSRAEAVLTALLSAKTSPGRLIAKGYGEAHPIASNDTAKGRALNRRIEFTLIEDPE